MNSPNPTHRLEKILRKIIQHVDEATEDRASIAYMYDRLRLIRQLAAYGVERVIGEDAPYVE